MTTDYELKRAISDIQSRISSLDYQFRKPSEPRRDGSLVARMAAALLIGRASKRPPSAVAAQLWPHDVHLKAARGPALTGQAAWAAELVAVVTADISDRMLGASVFS